MIKNLLKINNNEKDVLKANKTSADQANSNTASDIDWSFKKIDIASVAKPSPKRVPKILLIFSVIAIALFILFIAAFIPARSTYSKSKELITVSKELAAELKTQNIEGAKQKLPQVRKKLDETKNTANSMMIIRALPFINQYYSDLIHGLNAYQYGLDALEITITTVEPYADLLGLKGGSSFVSGSADERIQLAVATLDKVTPKISEIGVVVEKLKKEIDEIDPNRYPEKIREISIRTKIIEAKNMVNDSTSLFLNARPLLEILPQLLGSGEEKRYLILFQNDKELRATGGFITAYAIFKVKQGKFIVEKSDDIYELDDQIIKKQAAPEEILTYHKGVYYFNIRDSNLSPDFNFSMKQFEQLYPHKFDFNGIIAVDTHVLVESIKILGTFVVKGRTFSAETDKRCDCPKVIYELEDYSTRPVAYVREDRKDVLGELLLQIMKKALGVSPSQYWGKLFQMALTEINEKHILAYMKDEKAQKGVESLNMAGRIADSVEILGYQDEKEWDYLHVNNTNFAGAKSNMFIQESVKQEYGLESNESITKSLTLAYKNPSPPSDCNLESGGLCLNGIMRNWVRIYVPKGSVLIESQGSESPKDGSSQELKTSESLGKTVFEGFLTIRPLGAANLTLKYKLPFKKKDKLPLLIQKQPGTDGHEYTILVGGKEKNKLQLKTDVVVNIVL